VARCYSIALMNLEPKSIKEYERVLNKYPRHVLKKMHSFIDIAIDQIVSDAIQLNLLGSKLDKEGLNVNDIENFHSIFSSKQFQIFPPSEKLKLFKHYRFEQIETEDDYAYIELFPPAEQGRKNIFNIFEALKNLIQNPKDKITVGVEIEIFLDKHGNLWREPKEKFNYPIEKGSRRLTIVKLLIEHANKNDDYIKTEKIADSIHATREQVRADANRIKPIARKNLKLQYDFIEGRQDSGYRINPSFKVKIIK